MTIADSLIQLLNGDLVVIETPEVSVETEVVDHERHPYESTSDDRFRYRLRFMPVGEDATDVTADAYHVTIEPQEGGGWRIGELYAEVYDENTLSYEPESRGEISSVEVQRNI